MKKPHLGLNSLAVMLASLLSAASLSAQTLNFLTTAPTPTNGDVFNFTGSLADSANVSDGATYADGGANDAFTYAAGDRPSKGQTFTTGATAGKVTAIWVRHVGYTNEAPSTFWSFASGAPFTFRITDPSQVNTGNFALDMETYTISGAEPNNPGGFAFSVTGTGLWLRFGLTNSVTLSPNTTYGFDLTSVGGDFFETWGTSNDVYSGGSAYMGSTAGAVDSTLVPLVGDRAFLVEFNGGTFSPPPVLPPVVTNQPANQMVPLGANAVFTPTYTGTAPFTYQWYFNTNTLLNGQTNATLTVAGVTTNLVGGYSVIASNASGTATSRVARLSAILPSLTTNFNFSAAGGNILDQNGVATGLKTRLAGTGASIPANDPNLLLDTGNGVLNITSPTCDFNGQLLMDSAEAVGFNLSTIGFNGTQDFTITGTFTNLPIGTYVNYDQVGIFAGLTTTNFVRGGLIFNSDFANLSSYGVGNQNGGDIGIATAAAPPDDMVVTIARAAGVWSLNVNGLSVTPAASLAFLNNTNDYTVGLFALDTSGTHNTTTVNTFSASLFSGPKLNIAQTGNNLTFTWNVVGAGLESNTNLANPNGWTAVPGSTTSPIVITLPTSGNNFYRIAQ